MTDYTQTAKGVGVFLAGYILGYVLGLVLPAIITAAVGSADYAWINQIGQFSMILIWVLGILIIPNYFFLKGIQTPTEGEPFIQIVISVLMLLFTFVFLYKGNFVITGLAGLVESSLLSGLYWIGILLVIGFGMITTPIATIIQVSQKGQ